MILVEQKLYFFTSINYSIVDLDNGCLHLFVYNKMVLEICEVEHGGCEQIKVSHDKGIVIDQ